MAPVLLCLFVVGFGATEYLLSPACRVSSKASSSFATRGGQARTSNDF
jgi:hypothetical protein